MENWKTCPNPFNEYEVSDLGRVKRLGRLKKIQVNKANGYSYVILYAGDELKAWTINRLVLTVFKGVRDRTFDARHLDGDKSNNKLSNLAWGTRKENEKDKKEHGRTAAGMVNGLSKLTDAAVRKIREQHKQGLSTYKIASNHGVCQQNISCIVNYKTWKHI